MSKLLTWARKLSRRNKPAPSPSSSPSPSPTTTVETDNPSPRAIHISDIKRSPTKPCHADNAADPQSVVVLVANAQGATDYSRVYRLLERENEFGNEFDAIDEYDTTYFCDGYCYEVSFDPAELCGFGLAYLSGCLPHHFCLVFTYDASSRESWDETVAAYENIRSRCENGVLPFVGTMIAAMGDGPVSHEEAETFASERDCLFAKVTGCGATDITSTTNTASTATATCRVVIPRDPMNVDGLRDALLHELPGSSNFYESKTDRLGTTFFFIPYFTDDQTDAIRNHAQVADTYVLKGSLTSDYWKVVNNPSTGNSRAAEDQFENNGTIRGRSMLAKRAEKVDQDFPGAMALLSLPPNTDPVPIRGDYKYDSSAGEGTYLYSCDHGATPSHPEFSDILSFQPLYPGPFSVDSWMENDQKQHGTLCLSKAVGKTVGIARKASVVSTVWDYETYIQEHWLDGLVKIHQDIYVKGRGAKSVVNLSISIKEGDISAAYGDRMASLIREIINLGAVFITGSGNLPGYPYGYPALYGDPNNRNYIPDLIVVGSTYAAGHITGRHCEAPWLTCHAPGWKLEMASPSDPNLYRTTSGTSFSSATVAGLAAYFRGLDSTLTTAASVKQRIADLAYQRQPDPPNPMLGVPYPDKIVWNGQQNGRSVVKDCGNGSGAAQKKRQSGGSCPVSFPPKVSPVSFRADPRQPTCSSGAACGSACTGFFCSGSTLTQNPDFLDPRKQDSVHNPQGPYYNDWEGIVTRSTGPPKPTPDGPIPEPGHGKSAPEWKMLIYSFNQTSAENPDRDVYYGFDDGVYTGCEFDDTKTWMTASGTPYISPPNTLTNITVYGKTCTFTRADGKLRCNGWATASCEDRSIPSFGISGGCHTDRVVGDWDSWVEILYCTWEY